MYLISPSAKVHGFVEHIARYDDAFSLFAEHGIEVLAFDQRGFGRTAAETKSYGITSLDKQLADIEFFLALEAKRAGDKKLFLFGHSMVASSCPRGTLPRLIRMSRPGRRRGAKLRYLDAIPISSRQSLRSHRLSTYDPPGQLRARQHPRSSGGSLARETPTFTPVQCRRAVR
jgi:hypothetical protein